MKDQNSSSSSLSKEQQETVVFEAESLRLGVITGVVTRDEVIAWADTNILKFEKPPYSLVEISAAVHENIQTVAALLRRVSDEPTRKRVAYHAFKDLAERLLEALETQQLSHDEVAKRLYQLSMQLDSFFPPAIQTFCDHFDDEFYLVRTGITCRQDAEHTLRRFLSQEVNEGWEE